MKKIAFIALFFLLGINAMAQKRILVFSKTAGFRHASIKEGIVFFQNLGLQKGFAVDTTENATRFTEANLKKYNAIVFLSTTGDVLNAAQQIEFERYIQAGGGFVGVHAATDTEYDWPWYNDLVGAYFASHPGGAVSNVQKGTMITINKNHPSTAHLPASFDRTDEFYDFKSLKKDALNFLVSVDEKTYQQGKMGDFHPMAWTRNFDGGKVFYSNFGHTPETFTEPLMIEHFAGGLASVMAEKLDYSKARSTPAPEENRFVRTTLMSNLNEPTELAAMPNGKVIVVERKGIVRVYNPATNQSKQVAKFDKLYTKFEYGLMGVGLDPNFAQNNYIYMYYTPDDEEFNNRLSRFVYDQQRDTIMLASETTMLKVGVKKVECCHTGGSIDWDKSGNLFLSTGDDTNPFASDGFAPIDFRKDHEGWDGLRAPGNTNDLRGKILRIHPETDGTYSIPEGNLFAKGTDKTRPEIYVMGCRNPYRISVDKKTGYLYWGDVGPDAGKDDSLRGPQGYVEFNQARKAGNYGWPMFVGNNIPYRQYDFETKKSGPAFDPNAPMNLSPNNTGLKQLPPTTMPMIWYPYGDSKEFPWVGKGGCNPMAGPVYNYDEYADSPGKFPKYFDGKFFAYEWMRDWIYAVSMDGKSDYTGADRFMPSSTFAHPMDMTFNKDGVLYVLDYGMNWFAQNEEATLTKIEYNAGNRKPAVTATADTKVGATPLTVNFSSVGTIDYDNDALKYKWTFEKNKISTVPNPKFVFKKPGIYPVTLDVTDAAGNVNSQTINIKVGNAEPKVAITTKGNKTFFFDGDQLDYEVKVTDKEDGINIDPSDIMVKLDYLEGFDKTILAQGHQENIGFATGKRLVELSDCKSCHQIESKSVGPAYKDVAKKYPRSRSNVTMLAEKIIKGGGGVWGEQGMAAHPQLSTAEAKDMVDYILSLNDPKPASKPVKAALDLTDHKGKKEGAYIMSATYIDKGSKAIGPLSGSQTIALRSPKIKAVSFDESKAIMKFKVEALGGDVAVATETNGYIAFKDLDLTGINFATIGAFSSAGQTVGGTIELRLGSNTGTKIGSCEVKTGSLKPIKVALTNIPAGQQTLYFVFINPATGGKPLFAVSDINFSKK
jgi:cytochrome c